MLADKHRVMRGVLYSIVRKNYRTTLLSFPLDKPISATEISESTSIGPYDVDKNIGFLADAGLVKQTQSDSSVAYVLSERGRKVRQGFNDFEENSKEISDLLNLEESAYDLPADEFLLRLKIVQELKHHTDEGLSFGQLSSAVSQYMVQGSDLSHSISSLSRLIDVREGRYYLELTSRRLLMASEVLDRLFTYQAQ